MTENVEKIIEEPANNTEQLNSKAITDSKNDNDDDDDGWTEAEDRPSDVTDTLLQEPDMTENVEKIMSLHQVKETDH